MENKKVDELLARARAAQAIAAEYTQEQVDRMVDVVAKKCWDDKERIAQLCVDDTGKATYESKLGKMRNTIASVYMYLHGRKSVGLISEDPVKKLRTYAKPVGVMACISPVTNPAATPIGNGLNILKSRNAMIVCPHPGARRASGETVELMRAALRENGFPEDLVQCVPDNTIEDSAYLMSHVDLTIATGGPGMVKAAYSSGKPALGVGPGNIQCILDTGWEDIDTMVNEAFNSRMVDFGMTCTGEQTIHCPRDKVDAVLDCYRARKAFIFTDPEDIQKLRDGIFENGVISRLVVGQPAHKVAAMCGLEVPEDTTLLIAVLNEVQENDVLSKEILCPITRIRPYDSFEVAVERARANLLREGAGHSSCIWTNSDEHAMYAAERIPSGRLMVNQAATCGSGRQNNGLPQTVSLGCGYWGGNCVGHNVNYKDMLNYTILSEKLDREVLTPEQIMEKYFG